MDEFRESTGLQRRRRCPAVPFVYVRELLQWLQWPAVYTVPSIGALALRLRSSCVTKHTQHTTGSDRKRTRQTGQKLWLKYQQDWRGRTNTDTDKTTHTLNGGHTAAQKGTSIIKWGPAFVWVANYGLGPYPMGVAWESKTWSVVEGNIPGKSHSLGNRQSTPPLAWYPVSVKRILSHIASTSGGRLSPRLGVLVVFLPPRILKKPFPKDERAFLEPKLSFSMVAGKVAEGQMGGFSLSLLISSLVFWKKHKHNTPAWLPSTHWWSIICL